MITPPRNIRNQRLTFNPGYNHFKGFIPPLPPIVQYPGVQPVPVSAFAPTCGPTPGQSPSNDVGRRYNQSQPIGGSYLPSGNKEAERLIIPLFVAEIPQLPA